MMSAAHVPVLYREAIEALQVNASGRYVDATYGRGGHSRLLLAQLGEAGKLLALDRDPDAIINAQQQFKDESRFEIVKANFDQLDAVLKDQGWLGTLDGLLLDVGVSSPQLDVADRGFGFSKDGALDMRMDPQNGQSAAEWLSGVSENKLREVLKTFGEERYARRIAAAIIAARADTPITRTSQLAEIVKAAHPRWERHHHPATRSFQAIRIFVNDELGALQRVLAHAADALKPGGRLVVISFHSLEDRIVKRALRKPPPDASIPRHLPQPQTKNHPWRLAGKPVKASEQELVDNPRARSAIMRVAERVA
jgi:16S rRNA (cytosine1402-N4)-methyltransferase